MNHATNAALAPMTSIAELQPGVQVLGKITPQFAGILTPAALAFVAKLHRQFEARRSTARFCGTRCRKVAERRRGELSKMDVTVKRRPSDLAVGTRSPKSAERTSPERRAASSAADVTLNHPVDIVPDAHWPNMWRLAYEDGRLSGMVNLTRARDALHGRRYRRRWPPGRRPERSTSLLDHVTLTPGATALAG